MEASYIVTFRVPIEAVDDVSAREEALHLLHLLKSYPVFPPDVTVKLQEVFRDKQPRKIELSSKGDKE